MKAFLTKVIKSQPGIRSVYSRYEFLFSQVIEQQIKIEQQQIKIEQQQSKITSLLECSDLNCIKLCYSEAPNMGDKLNPLILERIFNYPVIRKSPIGCECIAIGSGLGSFVEETSTNAEKNSNYFRSSRQPKLHVWGTGFLFDIDCENKSFNREMCFYAVRGKLSREKIEKITNQNFQNLPVGDAGILADKLIVAGAKKYDVGIIPHFREQDHPFFREMLKFYESAVIINLRDDPLEVIREIASCRYVVSSSLHGLIVADSFHIPNKHIVVTDKLLGDGFKFRDYYSIYDLPDNVIVLESETDFPSIIQIVADYKIKKEQVERVKLEMLDCCPFIKK